MPRVDPVRLETFVVEIAASMGTSQNDAERLAASLVGADLCGHTSHGTRLLAAKYDGEIAEGKIDPSATSRFERDAGVFATVDGRTAFGQVVARDAIDAGIEKAAEHGVGVVSLRNVSHIGRVGEWAERATDAGMALVGFVSNPGSRWVAPPGSAQRRFSTNPVVVGVPTFDALPFPLVHDAATSQVARSRIREQDTADAPLPEGWVTDESGRSVTDAAAFEDGEGAILPLGGFATGHKGYGLAVMSELMAGNGSDGSVSGQETVTWGNHAQFYVTDLERCTTRRAIEDRIDAMVAYVRETEYSDDVEMPWATHGDRALLPGAAEHRTRERNAADGIPTPDGDAALLRDLAADQGLETAVPDALR